MELPDRVGGSHHLRAGAAQRLADPALVDSGRACSRHAPVATGSAVGATARPRRSWRPAGLTQWPQNGGIFNGARIHSIVDGSDIESPRHDGDASLG